MSEVIKRAAKVIAESRVVIGFTGAGISTESGIPDFRTMGQFWEGFDPATFEVEIDSREAFETNPGKVWGFFSLALGLMERVEPSRGHKALAWLGKLRRMAAVITQNVDGLHQATGSENVIEFHGSIRHLHCLKCHAHYRWDDIREGPIPPHCPCGYVLKPEVPLFGDQVNLEAASASEVLAANAQVMLVACTHGDIAPVNRIPLVAKEHGAVIVEVNKETSLYTDRITDYLLKGSAGEVLPALVQEVETILETIPNGPQTLA